MKVYIEPNLPPPRRFASLLGANLAGVCLLDGLQLDQLYLHYEALRTWNRVINLTAVRSMEDAVVRHYCESLFLAIHLPPAPLSIADLGSGAGFPGVPVAVFRPDCRVTLIESHKRKAVFLREATRDIPNISVRAIRAESVSDRFDWLVSRAVSPEEVVHLAPRLATSIGLLTGLADSRRLMETILQWRDPVMLPWGMRRVLLIGTVPRGTKAT